MKVCTVSFFGHKEVDDSLDVMDKLKVLVESIVRENEFTEFFVGKNGDFDMIATSAVKYVQKTYRQDNSELTLVLPYVTAEYNNNRQTFEEFFDNINVYEGNWHPKAAIEKRNKAMVDASKIIICYINKSVGGAYKAVEYAKKQGKKIVNMADR